MDLWVYLLLLHYFLRDVVASSLHGAPFYPNFNPHYWITIPYQFLLLLKRLCGQDLPLRVVWNCIVRVSGVTGRSLSIPTAMLRGGWIHFKRFVLLPHCLSDIRHWVVYLPNHDWYCHLVLYQSQILSSISGRSTVIVYLHCILVLHSQVPIRYL